jgi:L-fuculose-phosphate aldolase
MAFLRFSPFSSESELRQAVVECGRVCYAHQLMTSNNGNISVRMNDDFILITPSGISKGRMVNEDLLKLDLTGRLHGSKNQLKPSSETPMHLEVYKQRSDVRAVIHAHPVFATALTVAGFEFPSDVLPEVIPTLGEVPTTAYATPSSDEDAQAVHDLIHKHNAILLRQHGSLTVGKDLEEALIHLERIEHVAEVFWRAHTLGTVNRIPAEAQKRLLELRDKHISG